MRPACNPGACNAQRWGTEIEIKEPAVARLSERRVVVPISGVGMELEREPRADVSRGNWR